MQKIYQTLIIVICGLLLSACGTNGIETSQKLPINTQIGSITTGGSIPGQYPVGYTGDCTGCEVVSGVVLDSYYDIFVEKFIAPSKK